MKKPRCFGKRMCDKREFIFCYGKYGCETAFDENLQSMEGKA